MNEYLAQLENLLFSSDETNLELALELLKTLEIPAWPLYSDLQKCSEFFNQEFKVAPKVKNLIHFLHKNKGCVDLGMRQLSHLPAYFSALGNLLIELDLSPNPFSQLPECIAHFKRLKSLDFAHNQISELPNWLFELPRLENLEFEHTLIYEIPPQISQLRQLRSISFGNTPRSPIKISPELYQMKNLETIRFFANERNEKQYIDPNLFASPYIRQLQIAVPELYRLPDDFNRLKNLQTLILSDMQPPSNLAFSLAQLPQLQTLSIQSNEPFALSQLADLQQLGHLYLSRNMVRFFSPLQQLLPNTRIEFGRFY